MTNLPIEQLLDLTSDPEKSTYAKTEILRRFGEVEQKAKTAEKRLAEAKQTPDGQNILTSRPPEELKFKDL